jgi:hypothetical protein
MAAELGTAIRGQSEKLHFLVFLACRGRVGRSDIRVTTIDCHCARALINHGAAISFIGDFSNNVAPLSKAEFFPLSIEFLARGFANKERPFPARR